MIITTLREGFKKKSHELGTSCQEGGEGVQHLEFSVPTSLSVSLSSISNLLKDVPSSEGGGGSQTWDNVPSLYLFLKPSLIK